MGRKKSKLLRPDPKAKARRIGKLDKEFNCPFCNHDKTVQIKLSQQKGIASLNCRVCTVTFSTEITHLDEAVDVYSEWIDRCREANQTDSGSKIQNNKASKMESNLDGRENIHKQREIKRMKVNEIEENDFANDIFKNDSFSSYNNDQHNEGDDEVLPRKRLTKNAIGSSLFDDD